MAKSGKRPPAPSKKTAAAAPTVGAPPSTAAWMDRVAPAETDAVRLQWVFRILAGAGLLAMLLLALQSGINADDKFQNDYSGKLISYYSSFGADTSALHVPDGNMHLYGGFFEILTGFTNEALGYDTGDLGYHNVRHLFSAFFGWLAILCAALLAKHIGGWRAGIFSMLILLLSPRLIGDAMMNPKDIPFAAGYMMALYNMVRVLDRIEKPSWTHLAGLVGGLAIGLSMRAGGLLSFAFLGMFAGLHLVLKNGIGGLFQGKILGRYILYAGGAAVAGYVLAILFWPYALQSPLRNPFLALSKFSELEVKIRVLYEGVNVMSDKTPWHYPVKWILYTIPLAALVGFSGSIVLSASLLRRYQPLWVFLLLFAALFPVAYIVYKDSVIHDGWRHLTFAYPPLGAAAGLFWSDLAARFKAARAALIGVAGAVVLLLADAAAFIATNPAYPYVYFNPIPGGIKGAFGQFETDYWGISTRQGIEWLEQQGVLGENMEQPVVIATNMYYSVRQLTDKYGDNVKVKYLKWEKRCDDAWDYALYPTRFLDGATLQKGYWPPDNAVHTVEAWGVPLLAVLKDNGKNCSLAFASLKLGDWAGAISFFQKELEAVPDNDLAWSNLAQAYLNNNQLEEGKAAAEKALEISPDDMQANNLIGMYWLYKNDAAQAKAQFELALRKEPSNPGAYYYLAIIAQNSGDNQTALNHLMKAIQAAPNFRPAYELSARIYESTGNPEAAQQFRAALNQIR